MLSKNLTESKDKIDRISKQVYQNYFSTLNKLDKNSPNNFANKKRTNIPSELNLSLTPSFDTNNFNFTIKRNYKSKTISKKNSLTKIRKNVVLDSLTNQNIRKISLLTIDFEYSHIYPQHPSGI